ncbi:MAG: hypothetical protein RJQ14_18965 [Marinoscillum sp.]
MLPALPTGAFSHSFALRTCLCRSTTAPGCTRWCSWFGLCLWAYCSGWLMVSGCTDLIASRRLANLACLIAFLASRLKGQFGLGVAEIATALPVIFLACFGDEDFGVLSIGRSTGR